MVDCFAASCLTKEEAESGTAGEEAEGDGGIFDGEGEEVGLDGEISVNVDAKWDSSKTDPGAPGVDEAVVVAVDEDPEIMDPCKEGKVVAGFEEGAWWQ